jgi:hypothetical protein
MAADPILPCKSTDAAKGEHEVAQAAPQMNLPQGERLQDHEVAALQPCLGGYQASLPEWHYRFFACE